MSPTPRRKLPGGLPRRLPVGLPVAPFYVAATEMVRLTGALQALTAAVEHLARADDARGHDKATEPPATEALKRCSWCNCDEADHYAGMCRNGCSGCAQGAVVQRTHEPMPARAPTKGKTMTPITCTATGNNYPDLTAYHAHVRTLLMAYAAGLARQGFTRPTSRVSMHEGRGVKVTRSQFEDAIIIHWGPLGGEPDVVACATTVDEVRSYLADLANYRAEADK